MKHRISAAAFKEIRKRPGVLLATCALRRTIRHTLQFRQNSTGVVVLIVEKDWIPRFERAAQLLLTGQHRAFFRAETSRDQVVTFEAGERKKPIIDVLGANAQTIIITDNYEALPSKVKLAADVSMTVRKPTARHVMAVRKLTGKPTVPLSVAERLVEEDWEVIEALLCRHSLDELPFGQGFEAGVKPPIKDVAPLSQLPGLTGVRTWALELAIDLAEWRAGRLAWSEVDRSALMVAPPGMGKTMAAASLAAELGIPLVSTSAGQWQSSGTGHLGDMLRAMRESFEEARAKGSAILFVDEMDSIGNREHRSQSMFYETQVVNCFLELCSASASWQGFVLIGATNRVADIDRAILRAGRFERHILFEPLTLQERASILSYHLGGFPTEQLRSFTDVLLGPTPADLERMSRAIKRSARMERRQVRVEDVEKNMPKRVKQSDVALRRVAIHELGHAVVALGSGFVDKVEVNLNEWLVGDYRSQSAGVVHHHFKDPIEYTESFLRSQIRVALAGMAAEELVLESRSEGAGNADGCDLDIATRIAKRMILSLGMGKTPRFYGDETRLPTDLLLSAPLSREVDRILQAEFENTKVFLTDKEAALTRVADALVEKKRLILRSEDFEAESKRLEN